MFRGRGLYMLYLPQERRWLKNPKDDFHLLKNQPPGGSTTWWWLVTLSLVAGDKGKGLRSKNYTHPGDS